MDLTKTLTLAIDFDGTIVEDAYPKVGKAKIFAFETLKKLQQDGHRLILWTYQTMEKHCKMPSIFVKKMDLNFMLSTVVFRTKSMTLKKVEK